MTIASTAVNSRREESYPAPVVGELRRAAALVILPVSSLAGQEPCQIKTERFKLLVADVFDVCFFCGKHGKQGLRDVQLPAHLGDRPCTGPSRSLFNQGYVAMTYLCLCSQFVLFYSRDRT